MLTPAGNCCRGRSPRGATARSAGVDARARREVRAVVVLRAETAYAVVDLESSGATKGTVLGVDEMNVLANGDHMSSRETLSFPLGSGAHVLKPKLGLYRDNIPYAVTSMEAANIQP